MLETFRWYRKVLGLNQEKKKGQTMTADKEQIIINGVDVSECDFIAKKDVYCSYSGEYTAYKGECGLADGGMCKANSKCFYKKTLQRLSCKTQKCEQLKEDYKELEKRHNEAFQDFERLKQECEELKEKYKWYEHYKKAALYNKDLCNKKSDEIACYKQTLKKIKKIVSNISSYTAREERQIEQILQACEVLCGGK